MFSGRLDEMGDEWHVRLQEWYERSLQKLRKKWWLWPLVFVVELIWHRIYGAVNEFLDARAGTMTDISKNVMGHVPADPITVSVVTGVIIIIALVVHAYIDTWRSQASLRQTSGSGGGVQATMLPSASLSVVRISNTQSRVLQFDTTGAGNQERSDLGLHPLKLLFEPPGGIVEAKDLPMPLKINGQKITVVWFTDTGFVVNDHGQKVGLRVSVLDSVPSSQKQLEAELFEAKRHPTQDEIRQIEIVGALRFYVWDIGELNKSLEEIQDLYMNDQIHRDVLLPLDSKAIPDEVKERKHRRLLEFRIAYRQHIVGVKQADRDFHSNLVDEGFPCDGQTYRDVIRKIENHHNLLRDQIDRRLKPFAKAANS